MKNPFKCSFCTLILVFILHPIYAQNYCIPSYTHNDCSSPDYIANVTLEGETGSIDNSTSCSPERYGDYTDLNHPDLKKNNSYTISISKNPFAPVYEDVRAWIDYDRDGKFASGEEIATTNGNYLNPSGTSNFTFTIPDNVKTGLTRLRIRLVWSGGAYSKGGQIDPCSKVSWGETEDYTVHIMESTSTIKSAMTLQNQIKIYPNPTRDMLFIKSGGQIKLKQITIFSIDGSRIFKEKFNGLKSYHIKLNDFPPGTYLIHIIDTRGKAIKRSFEVVK